MIWQSSICIGKVSGLKPNDSVQENLEDLKKGWKMTDKLMYIKWFFGKPFLFTHLKKCHGEVDYL